MHHLTPPPPSSSADIFPRLRHHGKQSLEGFCNAIHHTRSMSAEYGIVSLQIREQLYQHFQDEVLILGVVPLIPSTNRPKPNPHHTYIEVSRREQDRYLLGWHIWGNTRDEVFVLQPEDEASVINTTPGSITPQQSHYPASKCLMAISWNVLVPNLLDVFTIITHLSIMFPHYNKFTRQCSWLAHATYDILESCYNPVLTPHGIRIFAYPTPKPPESLYLLCRCQREWSQVARPYLGIGMGFGFGGLFM